MHHDLDTRRHQNPIQLSRELIHNKYYDTFNFYFSKPINEILFNARLPHVILLKDFSYYDDETEYFKRYYKQSEAKPRLENITNFYFTLTEGAIKLTLPLHAQNEIILKRNEKLNKLLLSKLQNLTETAPAQGENNPTPDANNMLGDQGGANQEELKQDENEKKKAQNQQTEKVHKNSQDMLDIKEHLMKRSNSIAKENPAHPSFYKMLPNNMNLPQEVSYDSIRHDIYDPAFSINIESSKENQVPLANISKKNIQTKRKEITSDVFLQATNWNIFEPLSNPPQTLLFQTDKRPEIAPVTNTNIIKSGYSSESLPDEPLGSFEGKIQEIKHSETNKEIEDKQEYKFSNSISFAKKDVPINHQNESQSFNEKSQSLIKDSDALHSKADALINAKHSSIPFKAVDSDRTPDLVSQNHKNSREEPPAPERHESSTTHIHISEENATRDIKYPIITIKNIQINKINSTAAQNQSSEIPPSMIAPVYQPALIKRPLQPQYELKQNIEGYFKPAESNFTEDSNESAPKEVEGLSKKAGYVKDLMKRHYGLQSDEGNNLSQSMSDRFKESSILAKLARINQKGDEHMQSSRPAYNNTNIRSNLRNEGSRYQKTRSNTDATLAQSIQTLKGHHGPQHSISIFNGSTTARTQNSSSSNKRKSYTRLKSNEGLFFSQESSNGQIASNLKQTDQSKLATEFGTIETIQEVSGNSETIKSLEQKRAEYKQHNKSKSISSNLFGNQNSSKPNLEIGLNTRSHPLNSQPTSASNKQNFKLDLGVVNSFMRPESSQGLFSSKSARSSERDLQQYFSKISVEKNTPRLYKDIYLQNKSNQVEEFKQSIYEKPNSVVKPDLAINNRPKGDFAVQKPATSQLSGRQAYVSSLKNSVRSYANGGKSVEKKTPSSSRTGSISIPNQQALNRKIGKF